jgi:hypothetical protein
MLMGRVEWFSRGGSSPLRNLDVTRFLILPVLEGLDAFSYAYVDQNEATMRLFQRAVRKGKVKAFFEDEK